ncbi:hypothetical protein ROZALSC1DRAFT_31842, partial [Rozella allomycis CSF55]
MFYFLFFASVILSGPVEQPDLNLLSILDVDSFSPASFSNVKNAEIRSKFDLDMGEISLPLNERLVRNRKLVELLDLRVTPHESSEDLLSNIDIENFGIDCRYQSNGKACVLEGIQKINLKSEQDLIKKVSKVDDRDARNMALRVQQRKEVLRKRLNNISMEKFPSTHSRDETILEIRKTPKLEKIIDEYVDVAHHLMKGLLSVAANQISMSNLIKAYRSNRRSPLSYRFSFGADELIMFNNAILANRIKNDQIVYRQLNYQSSNDRAHMDFTKYTLVGAVIPVLSFTSTAYTRYAKDIKSGYRASIFDGIVLEILLPKGFPGLNYGNGKLAKEWCRHDFDEKEVLLPFTLDETGNTLNYGFKVLRVREEEKQGLKQFVSTVAPVLLKKPITL